MIGIALLTWITWEMRYYETTDDDIEFDTNNNGLVPPDGNSA